MASELSGFGFAASCSRRHSFIGARAAILRCRISRAAPVSETFRQGTDTNTSNVPNAGSSGT